MYLLGLLVMIVGLLISVALHEIGHMLPAKKFGAIVPEYFIGFGPTLFSKKVGQTTYGVKAVLLGGYVRILGMFPEKTREPVLKANGTLKLADEARAQSSEELESARAAGATGKPFYRLNTHQKLIIMFGGPLMNLVLAFVLMATAIVAIGWREPTTTLAEVSVGGAAEVAGIQAGDTIVSWDGVETPTWDDARAAITGSTGEPVTVTVLRGGEEKSFQVTPSLEGDSPVIGITAGQTRVRGSIGMALTGTGQAVGATAKAIVGLPVSLWNLATGLFKDEPRDPNGALSIVGVANMAGEITAGGSGAGAGSLDWPDRISLLLSLMASLNIALFVFNLIPLPPLDGGHIAGALWGGVKNTVARVGGKPKPAPPDTAKLVPLSQGVFIALILLTVLLVAADLIKPMNLFG